MTKSLNSRKLAVMNYFVFKGLHIFSLLSVFFTLGAWWLFEKSKVDNVRLKKILHLSFGVFSVALLISGLVLLTLIDRSLLQGSWFLVKLVAWLALGASPILIRLKAGNDNSHKVDWSVLFVFSILLLSLVSVYLKF